MRRRVAVAAHDRHAGQRAALLGPDHVHDALARIAHRVQRDAELGGVAAQHLDLLGRDRVGDRLVDVGRRDVVVLGGDGEVGPAHPAPAEAQPVERLRAGDLVDEVEVDVGPWPSRWSTGSAPWSAANAGARAWPDGTLTRNASTCTCSDCVAVSRRSESRVRTVRSRGYLMQAAQPRAGAVTSPRAVTSVLDILIVLIAAKVAAEIAERVGFPPVVAEILAGVVIGPSVFDLVGTEQTLQVLGEIGVILLLLQVGMEMDLGELGAVGRASVSVAVVGVAGADGGGLRRVRAVRLRRQHRVVPRGRACGHERGDHRPVFSDLRAGERRGEDGARRGGRRRRLGPRDPDRRRANRLRGLGVGAERARHLRHRRCSCSSATTAIGSRAAPPLFQFLHRYARSTGTVVALALAFTLAFAELADAAQLAPIVGAFVAGLSLSRSTVSDRISRELAPVGHLFIPVFFLQIGIEVDVNAFFDPRCSRSPGRAVRRRRGGEARFRRRRIRVTGRQAPHRAGHDPAVRSG